MNSQITKLTERIAGLEKTVKIFQDCIPLSAITAGLHVASSEAVGAWNAAATAVAEKYPELATVPQKKASRPAKKAEKTSNRTGPTEWNRQVWETYKSMAEDAGVSYDSYLEGVDMEDADAVKKAEDLFKAAAKEAGVIRKNAMQEARRLKEEREGQTPEQIAAKEAKWAAEKARRKEKTAAKKGAASETSSVASAPAPAPKKKPAAAPKPAAKEEPVDELAELLAEMNLSAKSVDGVSYFINKENGEALLADEDGLPGDHAGVYDWANDTLDLNA